MSRPNVAAVQSYHNAAGMILRGPGQESGAVPEADEEVARFIAERGESMLPGYEALVLWKDLYPVYGGEFEWFYSGLGIISFLILVALFAPLLAPYGPNEILIGKTVVGSAIATSVAMRSSCMPSARAWWWTPTVAMPPTNGATCVPPGRTAPAT